MQEGKCKLEIERREFEFSSLVGSGHSVERILKIMPGKTFMASCLDAYERDDDVDDGTEPPPLKQWVVKYGTIPQELLQR